jgi:MFS family permease
VHCSASRRTSVTVYALLLVSTLVSNSFVPLAPSFAQRLSLSATQTGAALALATVPLLLASAAIGALSDRVSGRSLTITASVLLMVTAVGHGFPFAFWWLLVVRFCFGIGNALLWTAGLAWLAETMPAGRQSRALGSTVAVAAVGAATAPALAGVLADHFGLAIPFLAEGVMLAVVTAALAAAPSSKREEREATAVVQSLRALRTPLIVAGMLAFVLSGVVTGAANLLVPLQLRTNGLSAAEVGAVLSAASVLFTIGSATIARLGDRAASFRVGAAAAALMAFALLPVVFSTSTAATVAFVLLRVPAWAFLSTAPYVFVAIGATRAGLGLGAAIGSVTQVWALASSLSPVIAGALAEEAGVRWAYVWIALVAATTVWLLLAAVSAQRRLALNGPVLESGLDPTLR